MSFFPRLATGEFAPLFRLLDEFDAHRSTRGSVSSARSFAPKFDVKEVKDAYQLDGELPGIDQKDVQIEFTDAHTLVIKGRTERQYSSDSGPATPAAVEDSSAPDALEAAPEGTETPKSRQASVEDEEAPAATTTEVDPAAESAVEKAPAKEELQKPKSKYWVSERSVGEFHRTFNFPTRVDQDAVKASLKNGILSVVVPKAAPRVSKRISIE